MTNGDCIYVGSVKRFKPRGWIRVYKAMAVGVVTANRFSIDKLTDEEDIRNLVHAWHNIAKFEKCAEELKRLEKERASKDKRSKHLTSALQQYRVIDVVQWIGLDDKRILRGEIVRKTASQVWLGDC